MKIIKITMFFAFLCVSGCNAHQDFSCQSGKICVSARSDGDHVLLYLHNNTLQYVYVPEITDLRGPGIAFSLSRSIDDAEPAIVGNHVPLPSYDGQFIGLRPMAVYGVLLKNDDVKKIFDLSSGCQRLLVQAAVFSSPQKEIVGANVASYWSISRTTTELCL